jgi:hypothetical protein
MPHATANHRAPQAPGPSSETVRLLERNTATEARRDKRATGQTEQRIDTVHRRVGELAAELEALETVWRPSQPPRGSSASY